MLCYEVSHVNSAQFVEGGLTPLWYLSTAQVFIDSQKIVKNSQKYIAEPVTPLWFYHKSSTACKYCKPPAETRDEIMTDFDEQPTIKSTSKVTQW